MVIRWDVRVLNLPISNAVKWFSVWERCAEIVIKSSWILKDYPSIFQFCTHTHNISSCNECVFPTYYYVRYHDCKSTINFILLSHGAQSFVWYDEKIVCIHDAFIPSYTTWRWLKKHFIFCMILLRSFSHRRHVRERQQVFLSDIGLMPWLVQNFTIAEMHTDGHLWPSTT